MAVVAVAVAVVVAVVICSGVVLVVNSTLHICVARLDEDESDLCGSSPASALKTQDPRLVRRGGVR